MRLLTILGRILDAIATAVGVILGLTPDPTWIPIEHQDRPIPRQRHVDSPWR